MKREEIKNVILNSFHEKNNSHAFLLVTNNIDACLNDVNNIVKNINCLKNGEDNCECNVCNTIDKGSNPDYVVIRPDGKEIKKDQVLNLLDVFKTKPLINKYSIYTIVNADKLNDSSSNKILKFLEEPEENIVGFFITDKLQSIIPTIRSRCEVYNYRFGSNSLLDLLDINEEEFAKCYDISLKITNLLNDNVKYLMMSETKSISKYDRIDIELIFKLIKKFYIIKYENITRDYYSDLEYAEQVLDAIITDDINILAKRINIIDKILEDLNYNVNKDLVINKFFILWE